MSDIEVELQQCYDSHRALLNRFGKDAVDCWGSFVSDYLDVPWKLVKVGDINKLTIFFDLQDMVNGVSPPPVYEQPCDYQVEKFWATDTHTLIVVPGIGPCLFRNDP